MALLTSGVAIVTTVDDEGTWFGFTAATLSSLSLSPPLVLTAIDLSANCYNAFAHCSSFAASVLQRGEEDLAKRFATKGVSKFGGREFTLSRNGMPVLPNALLALECRVDTRITAGDHMIIIGRVVDLSATLGSPMVYHDRRFWHLAG